MSTLSLLHRFVIRDLAANKVRSLLTVSGIALGVAVMLAINLANGTALRRFEENIDLVAGKTNLEIHSVAAGDVGEDTLGEIRWLWDRDCKFTPIIDQVAVMPGPPVDTVQVLGVDIFADPAFRPFKPAEGSEKKTLRDNFEIFKPGRVYIGAAFARRHHLGPGKTFELLVNDRAEKLTVDGVLEASGPGRAFGGNLVLMDIGPAQELFGMQGRVTRIDLICPPGQEDAIARKLDEVLPEDLKASRPERRGAQVAKMISAFQYNLMALSLIALLVGMFLIYNTMSITVIRKRVEIGTLRVIGATRGLIFFLFVMQALLLGATGSLLGVGLGLVFAGGAVKAVSQTVQQLYADQPAAQLSVDPQALLLCFLVGVAMTTLAAIAPVIEAMSVEAAEASRRGSYETRVRLSRSKLFLLSALLGVGAAIASTAPPVNDFPIFGYFSAALTVFAVAFLSPAFVSLCIQLFAAPLRALFGIEAKLAGRSLTGSLGRTAVAVASLTVGIAMMVSLAIMIGSFRQTVIVWVKQTLKADLYIEPAGRAVSNRAGKMSNETVAKVRALAPVEDVGSFSEVPIEYNNRPASLGAGDLDVLMKHGTLMFVGGDDPKAVFSRWTAHDSCIITESFALRNNLHKGDHLTIPTAQGPLNLEVDGIYYDYASDAGYIVIARSLFQRHFHDDSPTTIGVYLKDGIDPQVARSEVVQAVGQGTRLNIRTNAELKREVLRVFDNTFAITYALHVISIAVAILGVMNALFAITMEMRRDFAILKYIGATAAQIKRVVLIQAGLLGFLGNAAGMVTGFLLSFLLIHVINKQSFGWTIQLSLPMDYLGWSFCLVMICSILSGLLPATLVAREIDPEAVRSE